MKMTDLEPKLVYKHFSQICEIPHPSGHEKAVGDHIAAFAESKGFGIKRDETGNIVISAPPTAGYENSPIVILQGHMDMVPEKNADVDHDFLKDPIVPRIVGEFVKATGTTLGADNGLGLAVALAIAEDKTVEHGPLEILCTVDEEVGLTGAMKLKGDFLEGRILLNLDGEDRYSACIGCAGGGDTGISLGVEYMDAPAKTRAILVKAAGMKGGHSGCDIHLQRLNANRALVRCLTEAGKVSPFFITSIKGGNMRNAIPREASAIVLIPVDKKDNFVSALDAEACNIKNEFGSKEPEFDILIESAEIPEKVLTDESSGKVMNLLLALPHGVERMSDDMEGLVETSCNMASMSLEEGIYKMELSTRSSISTALRALRDRIKATASLAGAQVRENEPYPGWKPDPESKLNSIFKEVHKEAIGIEPKLEAMHAGLECGVIGEKFEGMDKISIGPLIEFPHSPDERFNIESVAEFYTLMKALLKRLAS